MKIVPKEKISRLKGEVIAVILIMSVFFNMTLMDFYRANRELVLGVETDKTTLEAVNQELAKSNPVLDEETTMPVAEKVEENLTEKEVIDGTIKEDAAEVDSVPVAKNDNAQRAAPKKIDSEKFDTGQIIIKFNDKKIDLENKSGRKKADEFGAGNNIKKVDAVNLENVSVFEITDKKSVKEKMAELRADPAVKLVQPNYKYEPTAIDTDDAMKASLWALENTGQNVNGASGTADADIDAPEAWNVGRATEGNIVVAVIDSGIDHGHPDLSINMWDGAGCVDENGEELGSCQHGYDFEDGDKNPAPDMISSVHGTHVAGIIGAAKGNGIGIIGANPGAKLMALKFDYTTIQAIRAIQFAEMNGAKVINASWVGTTEDPLLTEAISEFDGIFVTAAGNGGGDLIGDNVDQTPLYPCSSEAANIICVAASDQNDNLASFSNFGAASVDMAVPGKNILSTVPGGGYHYQSGTSMATAMLSGAAAYVWSYSPDEQWEEIKNIILEKGDQKDSVAGKVSSGRRLNLKMAAEEITHSSKSVLSFSFQSFSPAVAGVIDEENGTISISAPSGADLSSVIPSIMHSGSSISPDPGLAYDFRSPVIFTVTAEDGSTKSYLVVVIGQTVKKSDSSKKSSTPVRYIKDSKKKVRQGEVLKQYGKKFSKNNQVALYFSRADGTFYPPQILDTDDYGRFWISYTVMKPAGKYYWYAVDLKSGRMSKKTSYTVI